MEESEVILDEGLVEERVLVGHLDIYSRKNPINPTTEIYNTDTLLS